MAASLPVIAYRTGAIPWNVVAREQAYRIESLTLPIMLFGIVMRRRLRHGCERERRENNETKQYQDGGH